MMLGILIFLIIFILFIYIIVAVINAIIGGKRKYYHWLKDEVPLWEKNNIISPQQGDGILAFYHLKRLEPRKKMDMIKVLTLIGSIFIGIGVIFFIASNWEKIPHYIKTAFILGITIFTLYMGYFFSYERKGYTNLGKSLLLLACLFWGGSIALIGQIYHLSTSHNWIITILWAFPILPIAVFYKNQYVHILASLLFLLFNFLYSVDMHTANYLYPVLALGLLLPTTKDFRASRYINVIGLVTASIYCTFWKYEWLSLFISAGLLGYYLVDRKERAYIYATTISFACWAITYFTIREMAPNSFFLIPLAIIFYMTYRDKSEENLVLALMATFIWFHLTIYSLSKLFSQDLTFVAFSLLQLFLAMLAYIAGIISEKGSYIFANIYKGMGYLFAFVCIYILSFQGVLEESRTTNTVFLSVGLGFTAAIVVFILSAIKKGYFKIKVSRLELAALITLLAASLIVMCNPYGLSINIVVTNAALVVFAIVSILVAVEMRDPMVFNIGILIFVLFIITRYIDVGWRLKEKSLFFIVGGLIIMALGASLEKQRRKIIERMREK